MSDAFTTGMFSLASILLGYVLGKRSQVENIRISRKYELAERISSILTKDKKKRDYLRSDYQRNFSSFKSLLEVAERVEETELHAEVIEVMKQIEEGIAELREISLKAIIYFSPSMIEKVNQYIEESSFSYDSDNIGITDNYIECFYQKLLDKDSKCKLDSLYKTIIKSLRRMVA